MALHLHRFDSQSQSLSILSENKLQNRDEEGRLLFQDTVPLDSPENQSDNVDFDTELLDVDSDNGEKTTLDPTFEYEEEIVLDSEDEEINGSRLVGAVIKPLSGKEAEKKTKECEKCSVEEGSEVSLTNFGKEKALHHDELPAFDPQNVRLKDNSAQELAEWSEMDALGFVDHFVSINYVDLSQGTHYRKATKEKSFAVSSTKGPQLLARQINMRTRVKEMGKFEWIDSDPRKGMDFFDFGGCKKSSVTGMDADDKGCDSLGNECRKKKGMSGIRKETMDSTHLKSGFAAHSSKDEREKTHVSEVNIEVNSANELQLTGKESEASDVGGDALGNIYDIGFNTQIAAEAIEALAHGNPFGYSPADGCQDIENTVDGSLGGLTEENAQHPLVQKSSFCDIGDILGNAKRRKRSDRKFGRKISSSSRKQSGIQELDPELTRTKLVKRKKLFSETKLYCSISADSNENSGKSPAKPIKQRKVEGSLEKNNIIDVGNDMISSATIENIPLVKEQSEGQHVRVSSVACQTGHPVSEVMLERIDNPSCNPREKMDDNIEHGIFVCRRKRSRLSANPSKVSSVRGKYSKLFHSSEGARKNNLISFSKVDTWSYPKRKRTRRKLKKHPNRTDVLNAPFTSNYQERIVVNAHVKGKTGSPSCKHPSKWGHSPTNGSQGSLLGKTLEKSDSTSPIMECGRAVTSIIPLGLAVDKSHWKTGKTDDIEKSLAVGEEKNNTSIASSNKNAKTSGSERTTISSKISKNLASSNYLRYGYYKRPCEKNVPKSSLLKELFNLSVSEHIPEFVWKELRRRKEMSHVRVLFSQHLDDNIVKQQKKIAARLGISIASCSMDATHFIADEFARTRNMLEAIALGKPVVTHLWLESCGEASCFIDERNHILRDAKKEQKFGFSMPVSLSRANQHPLLKGYKVFITPNIKPDKEMIANLVKAVHGQIVEKAQISPLKDKSIPDDLLILSCKEDHSFCLPFLKKGAAVYSSELLLNGIVTQKLEYKRHQLFINDVKRNCS